jgi:hypothetical protein
MNIVISIIVSLSILLAGYALAQDDPAHQSFVHIARQ